MRIAPALASRAVALCALAVCLLVSCAAGCATTELTGRDVLRVAPLRDSPVRPLTAEEAPLLLEASADALSDDELAALAARLPAHFDERVRTHAGALAGDVAPRGTARVRRCTVEAGAFPQHTIYRARCWVALEVSGVSLVEVEAEATRFARARAVTEDEAARIRALVRNPLLSVEDSEEALKSALDHAALLLIGGEPKASPSDAEAPAVDEELIRRTALANAAEEGEAARMAAATDLARWGQSEDATALLPLLDDERPRVRRAAALALAELSSPASYAALSAKRDDADPQTRAAVDVALARLRALYPDLRAPRAAGPSKSSTPGAGVSGATPRSLK